MKKLISILAISSCIVQFLVSCAKDEEVMTGTIIGLVSDYTNANAPIAGATVTINSKGLTKTTGSDGRFEFSDLEPGTYSIQVSANTYQTTTKQVTVYAGQSANCDFQLEKSSANVEISPMTLTFGQGVDQLSFSIKNNSNQALNFSISDVPDYIEVSPASGTATAKSTQAVSVKVKERNSIVTARNGQLKVNIGNDSYIISITVDAHNETSASVTIDPKTLTFNKNTELLTFMMTSGHNQELAYSIDSDLDILVVTPSEGKLAARSKVEVSVRIKDRKNVTDNRTGALTITVGNNTYVVSVNVEKYEEGSDEGNSDNNGGDNDNTSGDGIVVPNGLYAYFTFEDNTQDITDTGLSGTGIGTSYVTSYDGTKALSIPGNESAMFSVPNSLVDQREMSISFWIKDLYDGHVFHAVRSYDNKSAFLLSVENGRLKFVVTRYDIGYKYSSMPSFVNGTLDGWHMITIVSDFNKTTYATVTTRLYVDGVYTDIITEDDNPFSEGDKGTSSQNYDGCTKFIMGGPLSGSYEPTLNATRITIDNLRVYKNRMLSEQEIKTIYNSEKK